MQTRWKNWHLKKTMSRSWQPYVGRTSAMSLGWTPTDICTCYSTVTSGASAPEEKIGRQRHWWLSSTTSLCRYQKQKKTCREQNPAEKPADSNREIGSAGASGFVNVAVALSQRESNSLAAFARWHHHNARKIKKIQNGCPALSVEDIFSLTYVIIISYRIYHIVVISPILDAC